MYTINMERLATVVSTVERDGITWAVPDTLVGTDSHTPMTNAIGARLTGRLPEGSTSTDLALCVTQFLRGAGCASEFVEFVGPGVTTLTSGERGPAANMAPEYGASG